LKRNSLLAILCVVFLAACQVGTAYDECKDGVCITLEIQGPVQAMEAVPFTIRVKTEKDIVGLGVSITGVASVVILDNEKMPDNAKLSIQDEHQLFWLINTKRGEEFLFTGHLQIPQPPISYGVFSYDLLAGVYAPGGKQVIDSLVIYMDASGKQLDESKAKILLQTPYPLPTRRPDVTIVVDTPAPKVIWPSATPVPSPTEPYPAPQKMQLPEATSTPPAYPQP